MAAEAILSAVLEQLTSITIEEAKRQISLVGDVDEEVDKLRNNLQAIQAVLFDAEQRQVKEQSVRFWLEKLKDTSYEMEDVLDEWNTELMKTGNENADLLSEKKKKKKVCFSFLTSCFGIKEIVLRHDIALKIKEINQKLDCINKQKSDYHLNEVRAVEKPKRVQKISFVDESVIYGRNDEKNTLVSKLLCESSMSHQSLHVISLVGMGGIGKTTLAQLAYNNSEVVSYFQKRVWICVSDPFDEIRIAKAIIEAIKDDSKDTNSEELECLMQHIRRYIERKNFFLVLDDVWTEDYNKWEPFYHCLKNGVHGSKILITTRNEAVARMMESIHIMKIGELSKEHCQSLFKRITFSNRSPMECKKLEEIGEKIVEKCKGLPLAIKVIGSLLRDKETREEWQLILDNEIWKLDSFERGIFPPLLLSYNDLPPMVKSCFLYCAIFSKDRKIDRNELIHLWLAQGYLSSNQNKEMEIIGKEYFNILTTRCFFQELEKDIEDGYNVKCKMHDIVHDVALFLSRNECLAIEYNDLKNLSTNLSPDKTRHLMLIITKGKNSSIFRVNLKKLRSLLIQDHSYFIEYDPFPINMEQLTHIRTLKLDCLIKEILGEITKLIYLRFLHLVIGDEMEILPNTLYELYNLQTLRVDGYFLKRLSLGIEKLIKLRHLLISNCSRLSGMPKGIEKLTSLQTLTIFFVNDNGDDNNACTLAALKNLNQLRAYLYIKGLGNIKDASEIKKAELWNKKNLVELRLDFQGTMAGHDDHEILLKAFQPPPPNLEALRIFFYRGNIVTPNWMMSLKTLNKLVLWHCVDWECLPPLGNWLYLESLEIIGMDGIKRVSKEFLGVENGGKSSLSSSSSSKVIIFPNLKSLQFKTMINWEKWDFGITRKDEEDITIMPHLRSLKLFDCPKLKVLPEDLFQRTTLEELQVKNDYWPIRDSNQILKEIYEEWSNRKKSERLPTSN